MLIDVLRQFAITAVILVIVIAFGAAIKPLSGGNLLSGWDTFKYLLLAIIPMLQFALPFSGAFAATIGLHRMAQDNEFTAMAVCGQSYVRLLAPMFVFGAGLTLAVVILSHSVIPTFIGKMAAAMTSDLPRLLANSIRHHTPFVQGDLVIWAEDIFLDTKNNNEQMALEHVAIAKIGTDGRAKMYLTATAAVMDVTRSDDRTSLLVGFKDSTQWTRAVDGAGILRGAKEGRLTHAIDLPSLTRKRPSSLTRSELIHLQTHPIEYPQVKTQATYLRSSLLRYDYHVALDSQFAETKRIVCNAVTGGRQFIIEAKGMRQGVFVPPISVRSIRGTGEESILEPKEARLIIDQTETGDVDSVTLQMKDVIVGAGQVGENQRGELVVSSLQVEHVPTNNDSHRSIQELLSVADGLQNDGLDRRAQYLRDSIKAMESQIVGRIGQRWAVSLLPILVVLLGSVIAIRFPDKIPLAVYAKVFVPGIFALLLIFAGGQMVRDSKELLGFFVMWIGNISLVYLIVVHWTKLRLT